MTDYTVTAGRPSVLGATVEEDGVNFAVFSENAEAVHVCLFDEAGRETRLALPEREGDVWYGHVAGIGRGQLYGLRADGRYAPEEGHRFNVNKLLIDPYAKRLTGPVVWDDLIFGYVKGDPSGDLSFDTRDSAGVVPKAVVSEYGPGRADHPEHRMSKTVIYEGHVRGLTMRHPAVAEGGLFPAVASDEIIAHLNALGVTAIELLPIQAFLPEQFLVQKGLTNYWGYQTIGFFAPHPAYLGDGGLSQVRGMVNRFHEAGIEVILDVVYNHTGEGSELGPTLSFRGLDNAAYYRLEPGGRYYMNDAGTGNTLNLDHPMVLRMVMDSLRYWVQVMGVDGFRFDLASVLGRTPDGFDRGAAFFDTIRQDPTLMRTKLIAEPWDLGPGGYQLGGFPPPFSEWNDKFRDGVRRFWRGDAARAPDLADRITGSASQFDHSGRHATSSVNFLTAHDGFTLEDVVSYAEKHNEANGEDNRDGHSENYAANFGVEGPTDDPDIRAARARRKRAMMATLLLSQGTPMILAGDELGHSQSGNNNAYAQDNETTWLDWDAADQEFLAFVQRLTKFRAAHPILRQKRFLHARERARDGREDLFWWREDGSPMRIRDWHDPERKLVAVEKRAAEGTPDYLDVENAIFMVFNAGGERDVTLPEPPAGQRWFQEIDTARPTEMPGNVEGAITVAEQSVAVCVLIAD